MSYRPVVFSLTFYERKCLSQIEASSKVFPEESVIYAKGNVTRIEKFSEAANLILVYLKPMIKFATSIEVFQNLDHNDQVQLLKPFFQHFVTNRAIFNILPNGLDYPILGASFVLYQIILIYCFLFIELL